MHLGRIKLVSLANLLSLLVLVLPEETVALIYRGEDPDLGEDRSVNIFFKRDKVKGKNCVSGDIVLNT